MRYSLVVLLLMGLHSCESEPSIAEDEYMPTPLAFEVPANFPEVTYNFENNPLTEEGFQLGKELFYDGRLSSTGVVSCGFCHLQSHAFTHHGHTVSHGVNGSLGFRNAQPLANMAFMKEYTWDGAAINLDLQPIIPITAEVEMGETIPNVLEKLRNDEDYPAKFEAAFGDPEINSERMLKALSQFMVSLVSAESRYDKYIRSENVRLDEKELDGMVTFDQKCASCHAGGLFTDQSYRNNGLAVDPKFADVEEGRKRVTGLDGDYLKFKVPSLRNVGESFPYMHDGRFATLQEVMDHYSNGMVDNGNVDAFFQREDGTLGIPLTDYEKESIIAFLHTLTDVDFLQNRRFSEF